MGRHSESVPSRISGGLSSPDPVFETPKLRGSAPAPAVPDLGPTGSLQPLADRLPGNAHVQGDQDETDGHVARGRVVGSRTVAMVVAKFKGKPHGSALEATWKPHESHMETT